MRINQIQNLCWLGNVLVFAGMAFVGFQFYDAFKIRRQVAKYTWPDDANARAPDVGKWPPAINRFTHVWKTPVNGKVPPPPKKDSGKKGGLKKESIWEVYFPTRIHEDKVAIPINNSKKLRETEDRLALAEARLASQAAQLQTKYKYESIIGRSEAMQKVFKLLDRIVETNHSVVIHGPAKWEAPKYS